MYMLTQAEKVVRIPPSMLKEDIDDVIGTIAQQQYEGKMDDIEIQDGETVVGRYKALTVLVKNIEAVGQGRIVHGDGAVYQTVKFDQIVYVFKDNEVVDGRVVEVAKFGAFVSFGPLDGLLHVSQVMDARVDIDADNQRLVGKNVERGTDRTLAIGDLVRTRVVSKDLNEENPQDSKIGLTMRQPGLGKFEWIEEDHKSKGEA